MINPECDRTHRAFCAELPQNFADPMLGTAMNAEEYLFITWPKRLWAALTVESLHLPPRLIEVLNTRDKKLLFRLVSRSETSTDNISIWYFSNRGREYREVTSLQVADLIPTLQALFAGDIPPVECSKSRLLVCTHAKNDLCCGKIGAPIHSSAKAFFENTPFEVWESSHIGGHRFAATALSLPSGRLYGRITEADFAELLMRETQNAPALRRYRGCIWLSEREQFVEAIAHRAAAEFLTTYTGGIQSKGFIEQGQVVRGSFCVDGQPDLHVAVTFGLKTYSTIRNCADIELKKVRIGERAIPVSAQVSVQRGDQKSIYEIASPLEWVC